MTFILIDNEAVPCECRQVRQAEEILKKSGISEEFRNTDHKGHTYYRTMNGKSVLQSYENLANEAVESATNLLSTVDIAKNSQNIFSNKNTDITLDINISDLDSSGELNKREKEETNV